jgi:hypothetical protein
MNWYEEWAMGDLQMPAETPGDAHLAITAPAIAFPNVSLASSSKTNVLKIVGSQLYGPDLSRSGQKNAAGAA